MQKNIFITGLPGIGKTTLIHKVISLLGEKRLTGFYTEEIRKGQLRLGFKVKAFSGYEAMLSHVDVVSSYRVGKYKVNVSDFERVAIPSIDCYNDQKINIIVIDEIGKMECFSELFKQKVTECLDSTKRVLATIALKGGGFINALKKRPDVTLVRLTPENRDHILKILVEELKK